MTAAADWFVGRLLESVQSANETLSTNSTEQNGSSSPLDMAGGAAGAAVGGALGSWGQVSNDLNDTLRIIGRICEFTLLAIIITLIWYFWPKIKVLLGPHLKVVTDACRCRRMRRCLPYLFGLIPGCSRWAKDLGLQKVAETQQVLVITLLGATEIRSQIDFFIEAWTEPKESMSKTSRTHHNAVGTRDLGCERLEVDWFADEEEVVLQAITVKSSGERNAVKGELRIPAAEIGKYAEEAGNEKDNFKVGSRIFEMGLPKKTKVGPDALTLMILQKVHKAAGSDMADESELHHLKHENEQLKSKLATQNGSAVEAEQGPKPAMQIALRFEIHEKVAPFSFDAAVIQPRSPRDSSAYHQLNTTDASQAHWFSQ